MSLQGVFKVSPDSQPILIRSEPWESGRPLLSVIIPCYNYGQYIQDALRSIQSQTFQDFEIIVVDDGSTDNVTLTVLDQLKQEDLKVIRLENLGLAQSRNRGISIAKGKYVCCLDADDTLEPTYFEKCLCLMESNPGISFAYSHLITFGDEHKVRLAEPFNLRLLINYNHLHATGIFRRDAWETVAGYDPLMSGYEDWDFWIRLGKAGFRGRLVPEVLFNYRRHGVSLIDRSEGKHKELVARIRHNHEELYSHPEQTEEIGRTYRDYVVSRPFLNLSSKNQFAKMSGKTVGLIIMSALRSSSNTEVLLLRILRELNDFDFLIVNTDEEDQLEENASSPPAYKYNLPAFLDRYCWLQFVINLIKTREIRFVVISHSRLGYEWSPKIKKESQTPIVDILQHSGKNFLELAGRFDPFMEIHIAFSQEAVRSIVAPREKIRVLPPNAPPKQIADSFCQTFQDVVTQ
jgi:glycosyltransferase involved in cell wall biosynthesis